MTNANAFATDDALYFRRLRKIDIRGRSSVLAVPNGDAFHRHSQRFGPELVNETAKLLGVDTNVKRERPKVRRQRRTNADLTAQVVELHSRGAVVAAIADTLNIADRRVTEILASAVAA